MSAAPITIRRGGGFAWQTAFSRTELVRVLEAMRRVCALEAMPVEIILADDAAVGEANAAYLGCVGPTNVISFPPYFGPCLGTSVPGQGLIILSLDAVNREALLYGQNAEEHTLRLLAHGLAHLSGLDHGETMTRLENEILNAGLAARGESRVL